LWSAGTGDILASVYGAVLFLITFLLVIPGSRAAIAAWGDQTRLAIVAQAPVSYVALLIMLIAWITSWLIMTFWPSSEEPARQQLTRRFLGEPGDAGQKRKRACLRLPEFF
jgi:hypothetical protein